MTIQAIAFDLDGTLIHSLPDLVASANYLRHYYKKTLLDEKTIESYIGDGVEKLIHRTLTENYDGEDGKRIQEAMRLFSQHYANNLTTYTRLYPNVRDTLAYLHQQDIALALITNKPEAPARKILDFFDITTYFQTIYGGDNLSTRKPDPAPLFAAANDMNIATQNMFMVGDSMNDVFSGKAAGSPTIFVTYGYTRNEELPSDSDAQPDYKINNIQEIMSLLSG